METLSVYCAVVCSWFLLVVWHLFPARAYLSVVGSIALSAYMAEQ